MNDDLCPGRPIESLDDLRQRAIIESRKPLWPGEILIQIRIAHGARPMPGRIKGLTGTQSDWRLLGPFVLRPERQLLLDRGRPVRIGGRALDLLTALVERPGELVDKQVLVSRAWPTTFVDEANLKVNMAGMRRALGESHATPRYIATVVGRGYRFIAPVRTSPFDTLPPTDGDPATAAIIAGLIDAVEAIRQELHQLSAASHPTVTRGISAGHGMSA